MLAGPFVCTFRSTVPARRSVSVSGGACPAGDPVVVHCDTPRPCSRTVIMCAVGSSRRQAFTFHLRQPRLCQARPPAPSTLAMAGQPAHAPSTTRRKLPGPAAHRHYTWITLPCLREIAFRHMAVHVVPARCLWAGSGALCAFCACCSASQAGTPSLVGVTHGYIHCFQ